ncbi:hypothetical protein MNB_SV-13-1723 [hydrothermal vent metagenome]|uniref:Lipoprotein n=1 Tax=hydrothermal vent metagenome TaxID=652676 RepID=A0A1W1CZR9_9ZZZZ
MTQIQKKSLPLLAISLFFLSACQSYNDAFVKKGKAYYYHSDIYFGKHLSKDYKKGIVDGCVTSKGKYQKSHSLFRTSKDYENAWFLGRNRCRHLLNVQK